MRLKLIAAAVLITALVAPKIASADVIDDFTIVGNGLDITFSLPAVNVIDVFPSLNFWSATFPEIRNGVAQTGSLGIYFDQSSCSVPTSYLAGIRLCATPSLWNLPPFVAFPPRFPPGSGYAGYFVLTFIPGTYVDTDFIVPSAPPDYVPPLVYTITVTPQATNAAATPEPGTLALLSTGLVGGWGMLRRRRVA